MAIPFYIGPFFVPVMSLVCSIVGYFVILRIKSQVTFPRIGYVQTPGNRKRPLMLLLCLTMVLILAGFYVLQALVVRSHGVQSWWLPFLKYFRNAVFAAAIAFVAYRYSVKRWYLYALWIFAGFAFGRALLFPAFGSLVNSPWPLNFTYYVTGGVILLAGIVVFVRFIRNNPKMVLEELDEQTQNE